jgi:type I restriction enzyme S subunit
MSGSSGRQRVTAKSISMFKVSVPNKENKIFDVFGKVVNSLFDKISNNMQQIRTLTEIRDTLLPKLISGELRVPDAERIASRYL